MTDILCQRDSYLRRFSAVVTRIDRELSGIVVDRSAFYPGGGGQPCDLGTLAGLRVIDIRRESGLVWHVLEAGTLPTEGDRARL